MQPCLPLASSMMPWGIRSQVRVNEPLLQLVNALFWFCVMSGSVETLPRLGGKLCMRLIAKVIRISRAKFPWNRLTTVCTRYSRLRESHFWDTLYCKTIDQRSGSVVIKKTARKYSYSSFPSGCYVEGGMKKSRFSINISLHLGNRLTQTQNVRYLPNGKA